MNGKILRLIVILLSMLMYVGWVFYASEPKYIDNCDKELKRFDYVSIPDPIYSDGEVVNGIILQVDSVYALIKISRYNDTYYQLDRKKSKYRIIGRGTIYHKINNYVGFNIT